MWWGYSPPLDLRLEIHESENNCLEDPVEFLIVGSADARHITKTLASSYMHPKRPIRFHVIEPTMEQVARSILLLSTCLEENLGLQEATQYYLEILGNTLLRPATAKYLVRRANRLVDIPTKTIECPWLSLDKLKHRDRDRLEWIFKFWGRATCEGVPVVEYWDRRVRKLLGTRYDYKDGAFDWDFHMVLKPRGHKNLTIQEYRFWRNNGIAFTWLEGEPARSNPTLLSNILPQGDGFFHYAYLGDITNGPYLTWALDEETEDKKNKKQKLRATDTAEKEVLQVIHEIRTNEPLCCELVAAHRDPSILNGIIMTEMPDSEIEQESWSLGNTISRMKETILWKLIPDIQIIIHPVTALDNYKNKLEFMNKFDVVWLSHNMTNQLGNTAPLLKTGGKMLIESRKFLTELRKDDLEKFTKDLKAQARDNGLRELIDFDAEKHVVARFCKC
ncbi:dynein assembly factor 3, axonemal homolog [Cephus cinctus]|uniref:Dynein assembly factor 3, axonemal homolog n=1 Tax=Cephus cinctus TaxID=211228 RepID=A0AAJ7C911_CEPCN|nr:dynein assembly factor 3, axonemal homolog [Cephus cinctus]